MRLMPPASDCYAQLGKHGLLRGKRGLLEVGTTCFGAGTAYERRLTLGRGQPALGRYAELGMSGRAWDWSVVFEVPTSRWRIDRVARNNAGAVTSAGVRQDAMPDRQGILWQE